jgi:DNA end-binding protein Ku
MRSMWTGAISFGMVQIPVRLYAATEQRDVAFRQVHREDGGKITFRRVCSTCGADVPYSDVAKGYELPSGDMVVLTDKDLAELPLETAHRIEVLHFTPASDIDPILAGKSYYLEPEKSGMRSYVLFRDALERSGKVAVVKVALRQREGLAQMQVAGGVIVLQSLLWPEEVREPDFAFLEEDVEIRSQELKMAASLIETMTEEFNPSQYHDTYREALETLVRSKARGHEVASPPAGQAAGEGGEESRATAGHPADLTEALRASVAAAKSDRGKQDRRGAASRRRASA